jgi:hypothetical protein
VQACSNQTPACLIVQPPNGSGLATSFSQLFDVIAKGRGQIKSHDLQAMFNIDTDPCARGNTILGKNTVSNSGKRCILRENIVFPVHQVGVQLRIPASLQGVYTKNGAAFHLKFIKSNHSALLVISDAFLNRDWGGVITDVSFGRNFSVLRTEQNQSSTACLQFNYGA